MNTKQYPYQMYQIKVTAKKALVLGVNDVIVHETRTEKQARTWVDREARLMKQKVHAYGLVAWYLGGDQWNISTEAPMCSVAKVTLKTTRRLSEDISGVKAFRVSTRNEITLTVNLSYSVDVTLDDPYVEYGGPTAALKKAMKLVKAWGFDCHLRLQLEGQCRRQDIHEARIIGCWDSDPKTHALNLYRLVQEGA